MLFYSLNFFPIFPNPFNTLLFKYFITVIQISNPPLFLNNQSHHIFFMSRIEPIVPDSCCISPRFRSNSFRRSLRYNRLPPQLLRLSVLKLDGSSFEVQVERTATVAAVRDAVESVFCEMSMNKDDVNISWPHVWGHFCLCYKHFKLMDDKSRIQHFGIRDGDQLHFVGLRCPIKE